MASATTDSHVIVNDELLDSALPTSQYRPEIQGLRALAVVLVILSHAQVPGFEGGYVGVDVFFVISGYVITTLLLRQPHRRVVHNLGNFYARRVRRIVPAATVVLVSTVVVGHWLLGSYFDSNLLSDTRWASFFSENFRLINTNSSYFIQGTPPSLVTHFWSLAVEEQFYLFFPLVVFALTWVTTARTHRRALASVVVVGIIASSWWSIHLSPFAVNQVAAYYSPFTRFWELGLGALVALAPKAWSERTALVNPLLAGLGLIVILATSLRLNTLSEYPGSLAWFPCAATVALLWSGHTAAAKYPMKVLTTRPARFVGDISYSLYLFHFAWLQIPLQMVNPINSWWARCLEIAGASLCATVSYYLIENPIRHSKRLDRDPWAVALVLAICLILSWNASWLVGRWVHV